MDLEQMAWEIGSRASQLAASTSTSSWRAGWKQGVFDAIRACGVNPSEYGRILREHEARWCETGGKEV